MTLLGASILAATIGVFGSAGAEMQLTPANLESPLNPENVAAIPYRTHAGDATAFLEAASDDKRWKLRAKLRAEVSDRATDRGEIAEAFVQFAATEWLDLSAGRVIERWGTGYAWTPTALIGPAKRAADPSDRRFADRGRDMLRASLFVDGTSLSMYVLEAGTVAARASRLVGATDVSLVYRRDDGEHDAGISVSRVFGEALELHAELARTRHTRAVVGGQYTFDTNVNVVLELYHGTDGLRANEWDAFRDSIDGDLRGANAAYAPLKMGRTYAFMRLSKPFRKLTLEIIAIANLRDGSMLLRAGATYELRPNISLHALETELAGGSRSELAHLQIERATVIGARVYF